MRSAKELTDWLMLRRQGLTYDAIAAGAGVSMNTVWTWLTRIHGPGGGIEPGSPEKCRAGHLRTEKTLYVSPDGVRRCRECRNKNQRDRNKRLREKSARAKALLRRTG